MRLCSGAYVVDGKEVLGRLALVEEVEELRLGVANHYSHHRRAAIYT